MFDTTVKRMLPSRAKVARMALSLGLAVGLGAAQLVAASSIVITFDAPEVKEGAQTYTSGRATFTTDNFFFPYGPGDNLYLDLPVLEGPAGTAEDYRVTFDLPTIHEISFGFTLETLDTGADVWGEFEVFDAADQPLGSERAFAEFLPLSDGQFSTTPENLLSLSLAGEAEYGIFRFSGADRSAIDNFTWTPVPSPAAAGAGLPLLGGLALRRPRRGGGGEPAER